MRNSAKRKIYRVGVIGLGAMGQNHVRVYSLMTNVKLVGVVDINRKILNATAKTYKITPYADYREMINNENLDIISLAVPTSNHYQLAKEILRKKINLLIEKPLAVSEEECKKIIEFAKQHRIILGVGHTERFNPVITELKKRILAGNAGKIFQITIRRYGPFPQRIKDVGVILDLATHDIDVLLYLTQSEIIRCWVESGRLIHSKHEDLAVSTFRFKNKVIGVLMENWLSPTKIRDIVVHAQRGMFVADFLTQDLYFYENNYTPSGWESLQVFRGMAEGNMTRYYIKREEPLKVELEAFINAVELKKPFMVTGDDGLKTVEVAQRLIKATEKNIES